MPQILSDSDFNGAVRYSKVSSILSTCYYTIVVFLFFASIRLFIRTSSHDQPSKSMRRFLVTFMISTFSISTLAIITTLILNFMYPTANFLSFSPESLNRNLCKICNCFSMRLMENCCVTLAIWASDGFMIWRCTVLYDGIATLRRVVFLAFCFLLMFLSIAVGLVYMLPFTKTALSLALFSSITLTINVTITTLIVVRLLYHRRYIQKALGPEHGSRYMKIVAMCIESASLVVAFDLVLIVLLVKSEHNAALILLQMMVQVYVISPFLIIFKVAYDKAYGSQTTGLRTQNAEDIVDRDLKPLEFTRPSSPQSTMARPNFVDSL